MAAPLWKPECALSSLTSTIGKEGSRALRTACAQTDAFLLLVVGAVLVGAFWALSFPKWARMLPAWISLGYALVWIPIRLFWDSNTELAFLGSGLSKSEWLQSMAADSRTRLTVIASITAAIIVSLNAWISRWENMQITVNTGLSNAQKGLPPERK